MIGGYEGERKTDLTQQTFTFSNSSIETLEKDVKYVQN